MKPAELVFLASFVSLAVIFNFVDGMLPMPLPGVRLGTANVFALTALVLMGTKEAFIVTIMRVLLSWLLTGNIFVLVCSMSSGVFSTAVMTLLYTKFRGFFSLPWISVAGAWAFNVGQVSVAALLIGDFFVFYYLPPLLLVGSAAGWTVGMLSQLLCGRLVKMRSFKKETLADENFYR